jgi:NAD(P)-dependent dehydrogenase (short-subunit alcohol dehydrogenase family)
MPDRIALVTGANQGVGFQVAKELVAAGLTVLLGSRDLAKGEAAARQIGAIPIRIDLTDAASISGAADRIRSEYGRLDLLVNNAAIAKTVDRVLGSDDYSAHTKASNLDLDEMRAVWEVNVFGTLAVYQAMLPLLRESSDARIVNVSSGQGSLGTNADPSYQYYGMYGPIYGASKTALNGITLAMMIELKGSGIKVNLVSPAFTATNLNGFAGAESVEDGSREVVRVALLGPDGPTDTFTRWENTPIPW